MFSRTIACLLLCPTLALAEVPPPQSPFETLERLAGAFEAAGIVVRIDAADGRLLVPLDGEMAQVQPGNLHLALLEAESDGDRQRLIDTFVDVTLTQMQLADNLPAVEPEAVLPILRPAGTFTPGTGAALRDPFGGGLDVFYVADHPDHTSSVDAETLSAAGIEREALPALAQENLSRRSAAVVQTRLGPGVYGLTLDGYYESSLLLLDGIWPPIFAQYGELLAAVPNRDVLLLVSPGDPEVVELVREAAEASAAERPYPVSPILWAWRDGGWVPFE